MKKILTFIMVFALIMSMSVTAFAAGTEGSKIVTNEADGVVSETLTDDNAQIDAWGLFDKNGDGVVDENEDNEVDVIYVNVAWDAMNWIYQNGSYDAENMVNEGAKWIQDTKTITITNQSNVGITATPSYTATVQNTGVIFAAKAVENQSTANQDVLTCNAATAATGEQTQGTAAVGTIEVTLDIGEGGTHTAAINSNQKIGTITVTIAKVVTGA